MYWDVGVVLEFLSLYLPDFNLIEEHFRVLKKFIKKKWHENEDFITREFKISLEWCVDVVGNNVDIIENHFCYVGISIMSRSRDIITWPHAIQGQGAT